MPRHILPKLLNFMMKQLPSFPDTRVSFTKRREKKKKSGWPQAFLQQHWLWGHNGVMSSRFNGKKRTALEYPRIGSQPTAVLKNACPPNKYNVCEIVGKTKTKNSESQNPTN